MKKLQWLLPPTLLLFVVTLNAQLSNGFKALDNKDYPTALAAFENVLTDKNDSIPARWGIAQVLAAPDNPEHNYNSAFALKTRVDKSLRKFKDSKTKKKWDKKYDLSAAELKVLTKSIAENHWKEANGSKNLQQLDAYLDNHRKTSPPKVRNEAIKQQSAALRTQVTGGAASYSDIKYILTKHQAYIQDSFPGRYKPLQSDLFTKYMAEKGGKITDLTAFMKENSTHPLSQHPARPKLESAIAQNTPLAYLNFLSNTSGTPYDEYVFQQVSDVVAKTPLNTDAEQKLSQDEKWLLEDIKSGLSSGVRVRCGDKFTGVGEEQWNSFVRRRVNQSCGSNALHSMVQYNMDARKWKSAEKVLNELGPLYPADSAWVKSMKLLVSTPDDNIVPVMLENNISTSRGEEYLPAITSDEKILAFCATQRPESVSGEDIYISERKENGWSEAKLLRELSGSMHEAPLCFTADGNTLVFFKSGKIYTSDRNATGWGPAQPFPVNLSEFDWVADVHFVPGEQRVFFAARKGASSFEGIDIYMAAKDENGNWGLPVKLGAPLNTDSEDRSPFVHPDQRTMYFSSSREGGLGGLDVYKSIRLDDTWANWSAPVNLGKSINTSGRNWGYVVTTDGSRAYYSAKADNRPSEDLYSIDLPKEARPEKPVFQITISVKDNQGKPVPNAQVEVRNTKTGFVEGQYRTPPTGGIVNVYVPSGDKLTISAIKQGFYGTPVSLESNKQSATVEIVLSPVKEVMGQKTSLNADILFDLGKSELKPEAAAQIRFLAEFAKREKFSIELGGHTDPSGSDEDNQVLSQARAEAVRQALINAGIKADNVTATGYGESQLECKENTPECYKQNRRVEIKYSEKK